jgi:hypothetical protein
MGRGMVRAWSSYLPYVNVTHFTPHFRLVQYAVYHLCSILNSAYYYYYYYY